MSVNEKMKAIADAIRDKTKGTEALSLDDMATEIPKVFDAGKKAEHDAFWDSANGSFDAKGKYHFAGSLWNDYTFNPTQSYTFSVCQGTFQNSRIKDLKGILERNNVTFDFSKARYFDHMAHASTIESFPLIDTNGATRLYWTFANMTGQNISITLRIKEDGSLDFSNAFSNTNIKELIIVSGVIGKNGLNLQWSTSLNKASIISVFNALSSTTSGLTVTISKTAVNNAFGIDVDDASTYPEGSEYYNLRNSKRNWTVSYA